MSISLIESKRASAKSVRSTMMSVAIHAALITLAVYATASAREVVKTANEVAPPIYAPEPPKLEQRHSPRRPSAPTAPAAPSGPIIEPPVTIPVGLPPIDPAGGLAPAESLFTIGGDRGTSTSSSGSAFDSGAALSLSQVEKPALARDGNPPLRYPSLLESSRVAGTVLAQFVVDTLGHADMSTLKILESSNDLFSESLRSTLPQWRFYPAEAGGHKVKQIVQLPLKFVAPNR